MNTTTIKTLILVSAIGTACSAHAQLLGRGGPVGGMIGGSGSLGGQLNGMGSFAGHGAGVDLPRAAQNAGGDANGTGNAAKSAPATATKPAQAQPAPAEQPGFFGRLFGGKSDAGGTQSVTGSGKASGSGSAHADTGTDGLAGGLASTARGTTTPVRDDAKTQAADTRGYARSSTANATQAAHASRQTASDGVANTQVQPSANANANTSAGGNGSADAAHSSN